MSLVLKSNLGVHLQKEGDSAFFEIQADSSGFLQLLVNDGGKEVTVKMDQELTAAFVSLLTNANLIRGRAPQSAS